MLPQHPTSKIISRSSIRNLARLGYRPPSNYVSESAEKTTVLKLYAAEIITVINHRLVRPVKSFFCFIMILLYSTFTMLSAKMLNCGVNPNPNVLSSVCTAWCLQYIFNYKLFHQQIFCRSFNYYQLLYYNISANLSLKLLYVIYFINAFVETYILIVIFKLGSFFIQIGPNIALLKVKWAVAKWIAIAFAQNIVPLCFPILFCQKTWIQCFKSNLWFIHKGYQLWWIFFFVQII